MYACASHFCGSQKQEQPEHHAKALLCLFEKTHAFDMEVFHWNVEVHLIFAVCF